MLNGKNKVKGLYKDGTLVATWDKSMDPSDLQKAIASHVKESPLTEVLSEVEHVQSFPECWKAPEPEPTPEPVLDVVPAPVVEAAKEIAKAGPKPKAKAKAKPKA